MMSNARAVFNQGPVARHVLVMSSTSALSLLAVFLVDIFTLVYVSMLHDPLLLAATGVAKVLIFLNSAVASGLIIAAATVLSQRIGHRAAKASSRLVTHLMLMVIAASGAAAALQLALLAPLTHWLGADASTYEAARVFIWLTLPFSVLQSAMQMSAQILRTAGDSRRALWVVLSGAATLAVADPVFIFGFGLGLEGAGISYALSALVSLGLGVYWLRTRLGMSFILNLRLLRLHSVKVMQVGLPAMVANLATPVGLTYLVSSIGAYGTSALAAMSVMDRVMQFSYCAFFALPSALAPVLGQNIGAHRQARAASAIAFSRKLVVGYGLTVWAVLLLVADAIANTYELEGVGRDIFLAFCHVGGGLWALIGLDFVSIAVFVTMGRPWLVAMFAWLRATLGTVPFVLGGIHLFGAAGAFPAMLTGNALIAVTSITIASLTAKRFLRHSVGAQAAV
jgi:Na+-driven multidrug efflux pump